MINQKKVVVVMPAYNAEKTLKKTYEEIPFDVVDDVIIVDDSSTDQTLEIAKDIGIENIIRHPKNRGYGGNQKSCYEEALKLGADIVIMIHPDYQYTPKLCASIACLLAYGEYHCVLASRILGTGALEGGMPIHKYIANRLLTLFQNIMLPYKLSEYHSGYRAFSRELLTSLPLNENEDDFIFDNQMLVQIICAGYKIAEVTCPTKYLPDSSSINLVRSAQYGIGVIKTTLEYKLWQLGVKKSSRFEKVLRAKNK